jgi:hypothetical protein
VHQPLVAAFCETYLLPDDDDVEMPNPLDYHVIRGDRNSANRGGGVCLLVANWIEIVQISVPMSEHFESCFCDVFLGNCTLRIGLVYMKPPVSAAGLEDLVKVLKSDIVPQPESQQPFLLLGDFNMPEIDWDEGTFPAKYREFSETLLELGINQFVREPTRQQNTLDLVFGNEPNLISDIAVHPSFGTMDHKHVTFSFDSRVLRPRKEKVRDFRKARYTDMQGFLCSLLWTPLFLLCANLEEKWTLLLGTIDFCVESFVPLVSPKVKRHAPATRTLIRKARRLKVKLKNVRGARKTYLEGQYSTMMERIRVACENERKAAEYNILRTSDIKKFFRF